MEIEPKTDEEWTAVRNSAYVVAEAGNLLMMTGRAKDEADWMRLSQALVDVGQRAIKAAESKNKAAVFDAGAEVYDACVACHAKYALPVMRPNAAGRQGILIEDPAWHPDMSLLSFVEWLASTRWSIALHESLYLYPAHRVGARPHAWRCSSVSR